MLEVTVECLFIYCTTWFSGFSETLRMTFINAPEIKSVLTNFRLNFFFVRENDTVELTLHARRQANKAE